MIIVLVALATPFAAYSGSCGSVASVTADIWEEAGDVALSIGCGVAVVASKGTVDFTQCYDSSKKASEFIKNMPGFWNTVADDSWAKIGPRQLTFNKNIKGTLFGTGGRVFVSPYPIGSDKVTITIDERDGKGKASVVVCKVDKKNNFTTIATKWFNDSRDRKKKKNEHRAIVVNGARDHVLTVHFDGKSVANKFAYTLRAEEN